MSDSLECPSCRRKFDADDAGGGRHGHNAHCPGCGSRLIAAAGPKEAEVRKHLYGRRLAPVRVSSSRGSPR